MAELYNILEVNQGEVQEDEYVRKMISHKSFLANILVHTVEKFKGKNPKEMISCIDNHIVIEERSIHEEATSKEARHFDVLFYVKTPSSLSQMITNIEVERNEPKDTGIGMCIFRPLTSYYSVM